MNSSNMRQFLNDQHLQQTQDYSNSPNPLLKCNKVLKLGSTSMHGILHGENAHPNCAHYVDCKN